MATVYFLILFAETAMVLYIWCEDSHKTIVFRHALNT